MNFNNGYRQSEFTVYSNVPFSTVVENKNADDKGYELIKYRVIKKEDVSENEYLVSLSVPREVTHDFDSSLIMTHPVTGKQTTVPIHFSNVGQDVYHSVYDEDEAT